jgi:hypothetical protein
MFDTHEVEPGRLTKIIELLKTDLHLRRLRTERRIEDNPVSQAECEFLGRQLHHYDREEGK